MYLLYVLCEMISKIDINLFIYHKKADKNVAFGSGKGARGEP